MMHWYYCDESYDERIFTVAGLIAHETEWKRFEKRWHHIPKKFGVSRFHAAPLNCYDKEFSDWDAIKSKKFTKALITRIIERKMALVSCSAFLAPYHKLPAIAKDRLGTPYELCFKHRVALAAEWAIPRLDRHGKFSVIYDYDIDLGQKPVELFRKMKDDQAWPHRDKLVTCAPGSWQEWLPLQPADAVAFDTFKLLHQSSWENVRKSLAAILNGVEPIGVCFDEEVFQTILPKVLATEGTVIVDPNIVG